MGRILIVVVLVLLAAVAWAERVPTNPQQTCAATGRCGNISSASTITVAVPPVTGEEPALGTTCTFPALLPCEF